MLQGIELSPSAVDTAAVSPTPSKEGLDTDKNIGLTNVKRRLDLFFPDKHELKILEEEDMLSQSSLSKCQNRK